MPEEKKLHRRRWPLILLALAVLGGVGALAERHFTQPEKLTALMMQQARSLFGAELSIDGAASFAFVPRLRVSLPQPSLKAVGANAPWLRADSVRAVMPWRTLWSDRRDIERIELVRPVLDLDAVRAWLSERPPTQSRPPDVRFALHIEDGLIVRGGAKLAQGINADFASSDDVAAWLAAFDANAAPDGALLPPLAGGMDAATLDIGDTHLEGVHVEIHDDAPTAKQPP